MKEIDRMAAIEKRLSTRAQRELQSIFGCGFSRAHGNINRICDSLLPRNYSPPERLLTVRTTSRRDPHAKPSALDLQNLTIGGMR